MARTTKLLAASVFVATLCGPARAGLIWDQQPHPTGGPGADTDFFNDSNQRVWQLVADNFQLASDAEIAQVRWWGFYGGNETGNPNPPAGPESMRLRFYQPRPGDGLPGEVLYEANMTTFTRNATGRIIRTPIPHSEFLFEAHLAVPFTAAAGRTHWLEIVQLGDSSSHFRWEYSLPQGSPYAVQDIVNPNWRYSGTGANVAFQLFEIPEPAAAVLFGASLLGVCMYARSRKERRNNM